MDAAFRAIVVALIQQGALDVAPVMRALSRDGEDEAARLLASCLAEASEPMPPRPALRVIDASNEGT